MHQVIVKGSPLDLYLNNGEYKTEDGNLSDEDEEISNSTEVNSFDLIIIKYLREYYELLLNGRFELLAQSNDKQINTDISEYLRWICVTTSKTLLVIFSMVVATLLGLISELFVWVTLSTYIVGLLYLYKHYGGIDELDIARKQHDQNIHNYSLFIKTFYSYLRVVKQAKKFISEVELIAKGYKISHIHAPISRLELQESSENLHSLQLRQNLSTSVVKVSEILTMVLGIALPCKKVFNKNSLSSINSFINNLCDIMNSFAYTISDDHLSTLNAVERRNLFYSFTNKLPMLHRVILAETESISESIKSLGYGTNVAQIGTLAERERSIASINLKMIEVQSNISLIHQSTDKEQGYIDNLYKEVLNLMKDMDTQFRYQYSAFLSISTNEKSTPSISPEILTLSSVSNTSVDVSEDEASSSQYIINSESTDEKSDEQIESRIDVYTSIRQAQIEEDKQLIKPVFGLPKLPDSIRLRIPSIDSSEVRGSRNEDHVPTVVKKKSEDMIMVELQNVIKRKKPKTVNEVRTNRTMY